MYSILDVSIPTVIVVSFKVRATPEATDTRTLPQNTAHRPANRPSFVKSVKGCNRLLTSFLTNNCRGVGACDRGGGVDTWKGAGPSALWAATDDNDNRRHRGGVSTARPWW